MRKHLPGIIGKGYRAFWNNKRRYRVVKGGRGSKKSMTTSLWIIYNMMKYSKMYKVYPNVLVVRRQANTNLDSTVASLQLAIQMLGVTSYWKLLKSPLKLIYKPTGQQIIFRGMDEPDKLTSITVDKGHLCWVWIEEAYQINSEDAFNKLDMSIRGELPEPLFHQITMTFNPWHKNHWLKKRFYDERRSNVFSITRNYDCNEFLGQAYYDLMDEMRVENPRRFRVEGKGEWGVSDGLVFKDNWRVVDGGFDWQKIYDIKVNGRRINTKAAGMDFGFTDDTAIVFAVYCPKTYDLWIYDEFYRQGALNSDIYEWLKAKGYEYERIAADNEDPKSIADLRRMGARGVFAAKKGKGSVMAGIFKLLDMKIHVHPRCVHTIESLSTYHYEEDSKTGQIRPNKPDHEYSHIADAMRYMVEEFTVDKFTFG